MSSSFFDSSSETETLPSQHLTEISINRTCSFTIITNSLPFCNHYTRYQTAAGKFRSALPPGWSAVFHPDLNSNHSLIYSSSGWSPRLRCVLCSRRGRGTRSHWQTWEFTKSVPFHETWLGDEGGERKGRVWSEKVGAGAGAGAITSLLDWR